MVRDGVQEKNRRRRLEMGRGELQVGLASRSAQYMYDSQPQKPV